MNRFIGSFLALLLLLAGPSPVLANTGGFSDIHEHWAQNEIEATCNLGLMKGMGSNEQGVRFFSPENTLSRAQLAMVLVTTFNLDYGKLVEPPMVSDYYRDIDNDDWYAEAALLCAVNQIFEPAEYFCPEQAVSRIDLAKALHRSFNASGITVPMIMLMPYYEDTNNLSNEELNAMIFVSNTGIMKGDGHYFRPDDMVKRAELARILNRCSSLMSIDESCNDQEYKLPVGSSFNLSLTSNPSTGYTWTMADCPDEKLLSLLGESYLPDGDNRMVGQGGKNQWRFKALETGTTEITLTYARPWESVQPLKTFKLKITITPAETE